MLPKITLVTPTYNQAEFIAETLDSIDSQNYPALEHLIMDAESNDGTTEILNRFAQPWRRVIREKDRGQSDAINKGIRLGTGEITGWLNSDDLFYPDALKSIGEAFVSHPGAAVIFGTGAKIARDGTWMRDIPFRPFDPRALKTAYRVLQPSMFFRRDAFLEAGGLDEALEYAMDWELLIRMAKGREVIAIHTPIAKIRYYEDTKTSRGGWARMREIAEIGRRHNGPLDLNFVSFQIRNLVGKSRSPMLRRGVDHFFWNVFRNRPIMVEGWP